jgi:hypothetical protein
VSKFFAMGLFTAALMGLGTYACAQESSDDFQSQLDAHRDFVMTIDDPQREGKTIDELRAVWLNRFFSEERDGREGLSSRDIEVAVAMKIATIRADALKRSLVYDLNGDQEVTREEILPFARQVATRPIQSQAGELPPSREQQGAVLRKFITKALAADENGDGVLTVPEIWAAEAHRETALREKGSPDTERLIQFYDADRDGTLTFDEHLQAFDTRIAAWDRDADGMLSSEEMVAARPEQPAEVAQATTDPVPRRLRLICDLHPPKPDVDIVVIGGYEGSALSSARIGAEDSVTKVADVIIPPGERSLVLMTSFHSPTIIRLSGSTERVIGLMSSGGQIAAVGFDQRKMQRFGASSGCKELELWAKPREGDAPHLEVLSALLGRPPTLFLSAYTIGTVDLAGAGILPLQPLPGARDLPVDGPAAEVWRQVMAKNPGGLVDIDPETVFTISSKGPYTVLPEAAGLAQLVEQGLLEPLPRAEAVDLRIEDEEGRVKIGDKTFRPEAGDDVILMNGITYTEETPLNWVGRALPTYRIKGAMTFPAGLLGAHSVTFLLPPGVPFPNGERGHSVIKPEE